MGQFSEALRLLSLLPQLGLTMVAAVALCVGAGAWLDSSLGSSPWCVVLGSLSGVGSGLAGCYRILTKGWIGANIEDRSQK